MLVAPAPAQPPPPPLPPRPHSANGSWLSFWSGPQFRENVVAMVQDVQGAGVIQCPGNRVRWIKFRCYPADLRLQPRPPETVGYAS